MIFSYSFSFPLESLHLRYITDASTFAGEKVLGSFKREMMLSNTVLKKYKTDDQINTCYNTPRKET